MFLRLRDELGLSILVVTHDLGLAWNIADDVAVMYLGRIVESGSAAAVLTDPEHPYRQTLLSVVPDERHRTPILVAGEAPDAARIPSGCRFHPRCPALTDGRLGDRSDLCRTQDPGILPAASGHHSAYHLYSNGG